MSTTTSTLKSNKNYHFGEIIGHYRSQPGKNTKVQTFRDFYWIDYLTESCKGQNGGEKRMKNKKQTNIWKDRKM